MKIVAISDIHGYLIDVPIGDMLLICGDICPVWNHELAYQRSWLDNEFRYWLSLQKKAGFKHIIGVAGNHDFIFQKEPDNIPDYLEWDYLEDSMEYIDKGSEGGIRIYGSPWQPEFYNWAFNLPENKLTEKWAEIPDSTDILITHCPPYGYGDIIYSYNIPGEKEPRAERAGSPSLTKRIKEVKPKAVFFGHIHSGYGVYDLDGSKLYNCAILDEQYKVKNAPHIITIDF